MVMTHALRRFQTRTLRVCVPQLRFSTIVSTSHRQEFSLRHGLQQSSQNVGGMIGLLSELLNVCEKEQTTQDVEGGDGLLFAKSVLKKRKTKMNKHKHRKRMRKMKTQMKK
mmetsp:Transcript_17122/g.23963  ORF Transcript_17122/g.23963 Transcript_17122/m.23963 type:complete len:111 (-) Transcript_17122:403-735(-)